jgi:ribosome-binding protein aMBF1 (putative translation factor)
MGVRIKVTQDQKINLTAQLVTPDTDKADEEKQLSLEALGRKIAELSKQRGLNQGQLAEKLHVSQSMVSRLQNGKEQPPIDMIKQLGQVLEVRPGPFAGCGILPKSKSLAIICWQTPG